MCTKNRVCAWLLRDAVGIIKVSKEDYIQQQILELKAIQSTGNHA